MDLIYDCQNVLPDERICSRRNKFKGFENLHAVSCKKCANEKKVFVSESLKSKVLDICPLCEKKDFYVQRDFPQEAGCLIVIIGACFVPWTYGLSLPVVAILDFILYKFLPNITICYYCLCRIRGSLPNPQHKPFDHNLFEYFLKEEEEEKRKMASLS
ncbi:MAG: hypothetical protein HYS08_06040 [Chlamydiae bacterium]|nr:hypothetical protein [Chlamydiota bacterium]MBI3266453.1 hypothetical protein [Chlamydiota bacterium]